MTPISITVWLLISTSFSTSNYGTVTVVGKFPTVEACQHVQKNIPGKDSVASRCIQSTIIKDW